MASFVPVAFLSVLFPLGVLAQQNPPQTSAGVQPSSQAKSSASLSDLAHALRDAGLDPDECYHVRDFRIQKEDIKVYLTEGYLIFSKPVEGERRSAVFTTAIEGGDGEVLLLPPNRGERESLARYTKSGNLDEHFREALMIASDASIRAMHDRILDEGSGKKAPEMGQILAEKWSPVVSNIEAGFEIRMIEDMLSPASPKGMMLFALTGRELGNFDVLYDPRSREQIVAGQLSDRKGRVNYDVWTSFASRSVRKGGLKSGSDWFSLSNFRINATLDADLKMTATTRVHVRIGPQGLRVFPFDISDQMQVTSVKVDGVPAELLFQDSVRGRALRASDNQIFLVATAQPLAASTEHDFEFEHHGDVIVKANHAYFVSARATWYPHATDGFATYDLTFRYPRRLTLVAPGDSVEDRTEGDSRISRWRTPSPVRIAGFNLGEYQKISTNTAGFKIDVYGNAATLAPPKPMASTLNPREAIEARQHPEIVPPPVFAPPPDPGIRLRVVASDVAAAMTFYTDRFGPPALKTLTVAPIPATFGQGFPGLVYLSTLSYLDPADLPVQLRDGSHQLFFSDLMQAHEVAHQWWGNVVVSGEYQDEWMLEALASYSALMWIEKKKGAKAAYGVLDQYREDLLSRDAAGHTIESAGPIVWGARLESPAGAAWRTIIYEKGAWIFHMLRIRMGDERFLQMLAELARRYRLHVFSTADLRALAKEYFPQKSGSASAIDTFFDNWVDATGIPAIKLKYSLSGVAPAVKLSGTVTQSGVDDDFSIDVPVEIQFAKGPSQIVWVRTSSDATPFHATLRRAPSRVLTGEILTSKK